MRIKKFQLGTRLEITWQDIVSDASWHDIKDMDKITTIKVKTVGYFLQNKKKILKVAHSITEDGESDYTVIPWANVDNVEII